MAANGRIEGDSVVLDDEKEASALYAKGSFGEPLSGGALRLTLLEATYLASEGRLKVRGATAADLVAAGARADPAFEALLAVHSDLRGRGLVGRRGPGERLLVFARGARPGKDAADAVVLALRERAPIRPARLAEEAAATEAGGRRFLAALTDEEGDVTHYKVVVDDPRGSTPEPTGPTAPVDAVVLFDHVLVPDAPKRLRAAGYGTGAGAGLQLPFLDALHLARAGWLRVPGGEAALRAAARERAPDLDLREAVHRDLRARGLLVRTGFKFGTHFRAYRKGTQEEHAPYLVHALREDAAEDAARVAGFVRLAHAVRKRLLFALVGDGDVRYVALERTKP